MRVAMLGWEFPPFQTGGLAVHCYYLTRGLAAQGTDITFFMPRSKGTENASVPWATIVPIPLALRQGIVAGAYASAAVDLPAPFWGGLFESIAAYQRAVVREVARRHAQKPFDLIHCHDWMTILAGLELSQHLDLPLVVTVHSTENDRTGGNPWDWILDVEKRGVRGADRVIAVSKRTREQLIQALGADAERVKVVYNAIDASRFSTTRSKEALGWPAESFIVLYHGRLSVQKGVEFFLQAAKLVAEREPRAHFVISGKGELLPHLVNLAFDLGLADRVTFTGYLPDDSLPALYAMSNVFVLPSVSEPFGITVLEAAAAGTPVILSKSAGASEVLHHALRVDFWDTHEMANQLLTLIEHPELGEEMRDAAAEQAKSLTWEKVATQTLEVYQQARDAHHARNDNNSRGSR